MGHVIEGYLWRPKNNCFLALPMYVHVRNLMMDEFCLSVIEGFSENSFDNSFSISIFYVHLQVLGVCVAMIAMLFSPSYFLICFFKYDWAFVWNVYHRGPDVFLVIVWGGVGMFI